MEQILDHWIRNKKLVIDALAREKLLEYTKMILAESRIFNITGLKNSSDMMKTLIIDSIEPVLGLNVPRGTRFVDTGSGAGIPGIPLGIFKPDMTGVLVEAQKKKADFIKRVISRLDIANLQVVNSRVEDLCRLDEYREAFQWGFSRAFGSLYIVLELGLPLIMTGGFFFIYSKLTAADLDPVVLDHAAKLGAFFSGNESGKHVSSVGGLLLNKTQKTDERYPRNYAAIRREAGRTGGFGE